MKTLGQPLVTLDPHNLGMRHKIGPAECCTLQQVLILCNNLSQEICQHVGPDSDRNQHQINVRIVPHAAATSYHAFGTAQLWHASFLLGPAALGDWDGYT